MGHQTTKRDNIKESTRNLEINDNHVLGKLWKVLSALYMEYHTQKYNFSF